MDICLGSPTHDIGGKAIARLGDEVMCPQRYPGGAPHGFNKSLLLRRGDSGVHTWLQDGMRMLAHRQGQCHSGITGPWHLYAGTSHQ
ncbi:hypothetical protein [Janthinobacterium sp. 64]|uniref:hypothetical protein n=1 Tax=Janthinobacterium sp. 64 TaxID=2035208 RepID=UPI003FA5E10C